MSAQDVDIRLRVPAALREVAGGRAVQILDMHDEATLADLLDAVAVIHPALERRIRDERGVVRPHVNIFVGDDNVRSLSGVGTLLSPGDDVSILPAISGGDHPGGGDHAGDGT